jgi:glycosyltransferase involved in cell wall biosynthesis
MKVVFVAPRLDVGGLERQWANLVPALSHRGAAVEVFTLDGTGRFFDEIAAAGVSAECLNLRGRLNVVGALRAGRVVASRMPDLVFSTGVSALVVAHLGARFARAPHVTAVHSIPPHHDFTSRRRMIVRRFAPRVAACTVVTSAQRPLAESLGFPAARTHVLPNGVPPPVIHRGRAAVRAELGIADDAFVALLVATLRPEKRVDRFVDAVQSAQRRDPRIQGLVAGGGPGLEPMIRRASECVRMLGPRTDTMDLMNASDALCLTSDAEALPLAALEAMACGLPVVASDVGGMADAVVDGETGILVSLDGGADAFGDALVRLASDPGLATSYGASGRRRQASHFSLTAMVEAHLQLFRDAIAKRGPARAARARAEATE